MRILSQDKLGLNYDIPYDQVCLNINKKSENSFRIYAWHSLSDSDDSCYLVAEYSTEAKARKAMEMLHEAYMVHFQYETMIAEQRALFINCSDEKEQEKTYGVFCFPSDDEVEV